MLKPNAVYFQLSPLKKTALKVKTQIIAEGVI